MATYVLVHGAGGGGWIWKKLKPYLESADHQVYTPTLTGCGERIHLASEDVGLETHVLDVVNMLTFEELTGVVLVGHSYGGNVITGVADRVPERLAELVYLDANVPKDGQSLVDLMPADMREKFWERALSNGQEWERRGYPPFPAPEPPPLEKHLSPLIERGLLSTADSHWLLHNLVPHPARTYLDPVRLCNAAALELPRMFILCTLYPGPFATFAHRAQTESGWHYRELESGHDAAVMVPRELAQILTKGRFTQSRHVTIASG